MSMNRRQFLKVGLSGLAYFTLEQTTPKWVMRTAQALPANCLNGNRILVILQQSGGNDGLNTVIPFSDDAYYAARPTIGIPADATLKLDAMNALHPKMIGVRDWYDRGKAAILQCVGYKNPNFSHFTATDYYETGSAPDVPIMPNKGWVARFYDSTCNGTGDTDPLRIAATGISNLPDMISGSDTFVPPSISNADNYALRVGNTANNSTDRANRLNAIHSINNVVPENPDIEFLQRSANTVEASTQDIAVAKSIPNVPIPGTYTSNSLGNGLKLASQIIRAGFGTRIFYVSQGGYDTHANQVDEDNLTGAGDHQRLLGDLSSNINSFLSEMEQSGNLDRVLILTFSEFGRRIRENGSNGTDHGAANVMFAFGGGVEGGVYGGQPDLVNTINNGNMNHKIDFRTVYSRIIQDWFGAPAEPIFGTTVYNNIIAPGLSSVPFIHVPQSNVKRWSQY